MTGSNATIAPTMTSRLTALDPMEPPLHVGFESALLAAAR
jgi:hypothetical protein